MSRRRYKTYIVTGGGQDFVRGWLPALLLKILDRHHPPTPRMFL
jgi:hypothetical protein